jgi:hypothetical protein
VRTQQIAAGFFKGESNLSIVAYSPLPPSFPPTHSTLRKYAVYYGRKLVDAEIRQIPFS